jgi:hypothetical protein
LSAGAIARHVTDPYHWGARRAEIRADIAALKKEPCDPETITRLVSALAAVGDRNNAQAILDATLPSCTLPVATREMAADFYVAVGHPGLAAAEATRIIRLTLHADPTAYERRARALRLIGRDAEAASDERAAQRLRSPSAALVGL